MGKPEPVSPPVTLADICRRGALRMAFERVRENGGCRGADGVTLAEFEGRLELEIDSLAASLERGRYHPFPLLVVQIPKPRGGVRRLAIPTVRDRVAQTAVFLAVRERFEREFEDSSYAYREGRSVKQAVRRVAELRDAGFRFLVDADIDGFFDHIPHDRLLTKLDRFGFERALLALFHKWIAAELYDGERVVKLEQGIPQGSVVSPLLANLFLDELDENLALFDRVAVRYADDFVVLTKTREAAEEALELTDYLLGEMGLDLHAEKTRVTDFDAGFSSWGRSSCGPGCSCPWRGRRATGRHRGYRPRSTSPPTSSCGTGTEPWPSPTSPSNTPGCGRPRTG